MSPKKDFLVHGRKPTPSEQAQYNQWADRLIAEGQEELTGRQVFEGRPKAPVASQRRDPR